MATIAQIESKLAYYREALNSEEHADIRANQQQRIKELERTLDNRRAKSRKRGSGMTRVQLNLAACERQINKLQATIAYYEANAKRNPEYYRRMRTEAADRLNELMDRRDLLRKADRAE